SRDIPPHLESLPLSLHDALPISRARLLCQRRDRAPRDVFGSWRLVFASRRGGAERRSRGGETGGLELREELCAHGIERRLQLRRDRKSTRLNSSHQINSYALLCL